MNIYIREVQPNDAKDLAHIHIASWRAAYTGIVSQDWLDAQKEHERAERWRENILSEKSLHQKTFVALADGKTGAFATAGKSRNSDYAEYAELWAIYAHPEYFSKGLGAALFNRCARHAVELGCPKMFANVLQANRSGRDFYERMGAKIIPNSQGRVILGDQDYEDIKYEWKELML